MEGLAPLHELCFFLRSSLIAGDSMAMAVDQYCNEHKNRESQELQKLIWLWRSGQEVKHDQSLSPHRQLLYRVVLGGLSGQPSVELLTKLEPEILFQSQLEVERFVKALPLQVTVLLMGLCVPAVLILFFSLFVEIFLKQGGLL